MLSDPIAVSKASPMSSSSGGLKDDVLNNWKDRHGALPGFRATVAFPGAGRELMSRGL